MRKVYLHGGEDIVSRDAEHVNREAFAAAGGAPRILVIPWTEPASHVFRAQLTAYFRDLGARAVLFAELDDGLEGWQEAIAKADAVYLPGGDPHQLLDHLATTGMCALLKDRAPGVVIGNSGGALALCGEGILVKGQENAPATHALPGLALVDVAASVHYEADDMRLAGDAADEELSSWCCTTGRVVVAIPERSALVADASGLRAIGEVHVFAPGTHEVVASELRR